MKYETFWEKKGAQRMDTLPYTEAPLLVLETVHNAIKVILPDGSVKTDLAENYKVISESL